MGFSNIFIGLITEETRHANASKIPDFPPAFGPYITETGKIFLPLPCF